MEVVFLLALVFLTMIIREGKERPKQKPKKENKENQGHTTSDKVKGKTTIENINLYDA